MAKQQGVRLGDGVADSIRRTFMRHEDAFREIRDQVDAIAQELEEGSMQFTPQMGDAPATFGLSWEDATLRVERSCEAIAVTVNRFSIDLSELERRHGR